MTELGEVSGPVVTVGAGEELGEWSVSVLGVAGLYGGVWSGAVSGLCSLCRRLVMFQNGYII